MLTMVMLRAVDIKVTPVLVMDRRDGKLVWEYPGFYQVDHLMLMVETAGQTGFLDPGCRGCQAGIPNWMYSSREKNGIVIDKMRTTPPQVQVEAVPAAHNSERRTERIVVAQDGAVSIDGEVAWYGLQDLDRRRWWRKLSESAKRERILRSLPGNLADVEVELSDTADLYTNITAQYSFERADMAVIVGERILLSPTDYFTADLDFTFDRERQQAVWLRYPFLTRYEAVFAVPEGFSALELPSKVTLQGENLLFEALWSAGEQPGELRWVGQLSVDTIEIARQEYVELLEFVASVKRAIRDGITLTREGS